MRLWIAAGIAVVAALLDFVFFVSSEAAECEPCTTGQTVSSALLLPLTTLSAALVVAALGLSLGRFLLDEVRAIRRRE